MSGVGGFGGIPDEYRAPGGAWDTNQQGVASPQQGRPPLTGGLQQMQMLDAFRGGASMQQLQGMNPYTPRPVQFLPPALAQQSYSPMAKQPAQSRLLPGAQGFGMGSASDGISPEGAPDIGEPEGVIGGDGMGGASGGSGGK